jgi:hypothetical protein
VGLPDQTRDYGLTEVAVRVTWAIAGTFAR